MNNNLLASASHYGLATLIGAYTASGMNVPLAAITVALAISATYLSRRHLARKEAEVRADQNDVDRAPAARDEITLMGLANLFDHLDRNLVNAALSLEDYRDSHTNDAMTKSERRVA